MELFNKFLMYMEYPFVRYALITGVLIALASSILGVVLVLKRYSYIGNSLSNVAFGSMSVATVVGLTNKMYLILPVTILTAILLLNSGKKMSLTSDAAIAMIAVSALALGYLVMNVFKTGPNVAVDVCTTLFGSTSILTLKLSDVYSCIALSILVLIFFLTNYKNIFAVTFDGEYAKATGVNIELTNLLLSIIIAIVISLAMTLVGSLLVSALIVFPTISAMKITHSFKIVCILSVLFSVFCAVLGIVFAILVGTPVGSTIVGANVLIFAICKIFNIVRGE